MSSELRFDGKVALVTGAGNGLGRAHAHLLASRGAKVVVNDLGGSFDGTGEGTRAADRVVAEIVEAGGEAVANYDSVEFGDKLVQTALDTWGRIDIVVNNAGILRDVSFHKMSDQDWDLVYKVHVLGTYKVTHAAWTHMREQRYGRIVNTSSAAGIYGNFGQANYSMAKLGVHGLTNTLAVEGQRRGVHVNTIAPIAGSRMTETVLPPELIEALKPEYVSPLVAWLCHDSCEETGGLFEVGGGYMAKLRWERTAGKLWRIGRDISPEAVKDNFGAITDFDDATHPAMIAESMGPVMENVEAGPSKGGNQYIDVDEALGYEFPEVTTSFDERDLALYALGVGAASDPLDPNELQVVYELHSDGFKPLPTYGVVPPVNAILQLAQEGKMAPGLNYGLDRILHGEQYLEVMRPLPPHATLTHKAHVADIYDKGKNALVIIETDSVDEHGETLFKNRTTILARGTGGWGGDPGPQGDDNVPPEREPDAVIEEHIRPDQALLYRLSGDWNPLHADPNMAQAFGFDKPILHGLCTFGYVGRHAINAFSDGDPRYFKSIRVRFAASVFPGETLRTEMWKVGDNKVVLQARVVERDELVITRAAVELYDEIPRPVKKETPAAAAQPVSAEPNAADVFAAMDQYVKDHAADVTSVGKVFQFRLTDPDGVWTLALDDSPSCQPGETAKPDCTLELSTANFMAMTRGEAKPQKLYFSGDLAISGDVMASQKLTFLAKLDPAVVKEIARARAGAGDAGGEAAEEDSGPKSWEIFVAMDDYVEKNSDLVDSIGKVFQFRLTDPDSVWTLNLKEAPGGVTQGEPTKADCTLELTEESFMRLVHGEVKPQKLYFSGDLKISGDVMASQKLTFLQKIDPASAQEAIEKARAERESGGAVVVEAAAPKEPQANAIFEALKARLADNPALASEVGAVVQIDVTDPDTHWTLDLTGDGEVTEGASSNPDATLTLSDDDLVALVRQEAEMGELFQKGKLDVDGEIAHARKLTFLKDLI